MGSPTIWWVPEGGTVARTLTLPISTATQPELVDDGSDAEAIGGRIAQVRLASRLAVSIGVEALTYQSDAATIRELRAIERHLQRGGWIAFALNASTAWAGIVSSELATYPFAVSQYPDDLLYTYGWQLPAVGARLWIATPSPERLEQDIELDTTDTGYPALLVSADEAWRTYPVGSLVRDPETWPRLVLRDRRSSILLGDDRLHVDLEMQLIEAHDVEVP